MILVDSLRFWPTTIRAFKDGACHMVSDVDEAELHAFARRLGLKREWFQSRVAGKASADHYDLTKTKRAQAVLLGAIEVSGRELVARNYDGMRRRGLLK